MTRAERILSMKWTRNPLCYASFLVREKEAWKEEEHAFREEGGMRACISGVNGTTILPLEFPITMTPCEGTEGVAEKKM